MKKIKWHYIIAFFTINTGALMAQQQIALTIYNKDLALVHDSRSVSVPRGQNTLVFPNVAAQIDPTSVQIKVKTAPQSLSILEQNYEYDLISGSKIFEKYLEQEIVVTTKNQGAIRGTLLSSSGSDLVLRTESGLQVLARPEVIATEFPALPEGLIARPTLLWLTRNDGPEKRDIEVSYLTSGISWHAEYVGVLNENDTRMTINGWVSIENESGASYENAKLKLIAGDVHRVQPDYDIRMMERAVYSMAKAQEPQFEEKEFYEYHLYTLQRPSTIKDRQKKQVTFIPQATADVRKIYLYEGQREAKKVQVQMEFENSKKNGLGLALPGGKVRLYKADTDAALLFLGEDKIDHTPTDEKVRLTTGNAFDIVGERTQLAERRLSERSREQEIQIKLRNHKKEAVTITVVERFWGEWEIRTTSHPVARRDANKAEWEIPVGTDGEVELKFTVLMRW